MTELRRLSERSILSEPAPIHVERVRFAELVSAVVPGLRYHYAMYKTEISHGFHYVVAADRGGRLEILREPADWGVVTRGWGPPDSASAAIACLELINALSGDDEPVPTPERHARDSAWIAELAEFMDAPERRRVQAALRRSPKIEHGNGSGYIQWTVHAWVAQRSRSTWMREYRCDLPTARDGGPGVTRLSVVDSVLGGMPF